MTHSLWLPIFVFALGFFGKAASQDLGQKPVTRRLRYEDYLKQHNESVSSQHRILVDNNYDPGTIGWLGGGTSETKISSSRVHVESTASSLSPFYDATGKYYVSLDGTGISTTTGSIRIEKKTSTSVVEKAFLVTAALWDVKTAPASGTIRLNSVSITSWDRTVIGAGPSNQYRDVTAIVAAFVNPLAPGILSIPYEETKTVNVDGSVLAVVFSDSAIVGSNSVRLFFGGQATAGDTFPITFSVPIDKTVSGVSLSMSLGISYGFQPTTSSPAQYSIVNVNGERLTSSAGGQDDGSAATGALLTVGGIGDNTLNPADPSLTIAPACTYDDELYDLLPFVNQGDASASVFTQNPSSDDNIFFAALFAEKVNFTPVTLTVSDSPTRAPTRIPSRARTRRPTAMPTSSSQDCRQGVNVPTNTLVYNGKTYAVLTNARVTALAPAYPDPCQCGPLPLPTGWSLAPNNVDTVNVIKLNPWGNAFAALVDSTVWATSFSGQTCSGTESCYREPLIVSANTYIAQYCDTNVLIVSDTPAPSALPTASPTRKPTL